jgi:hypothetical protein
MSLIKGLDWRRPTTLASSTRFAGPKDVLLEAIEQADRVAW